METNRKVANARASAIVISHRTHDDTVGCLSVLKASGSGSCEVVFVSNGVPRADLLVVQQTVDVFVQLNCNTGAYVARNFGALFASAPILVFVEDDCIPYPDLLTAHIEAHERFDCISVRGVYEPKTDNPLNALAAHYDLGDAVFPQHVVAEGNASYKSDTFYAVGGWDDQINFGGAGTDLAFRLLKAEPDMRRQIYYPKARIRHDYAVDEKHLVRKRSRQQDSFLRLQAKHGEYRMVRWVYRKYLPAASAGQADVAPALQSAPRPATMTAKSAGEPGLTLIVLDRARRPLSHSIEAIAKIRRRAWDAVFISLGEFTESPLEWIQIVAGRAGAEGDAIAAAVKKARGDTVLFIDTATQITADAIRSHVALYQEYDIIAVQGAVKAPDYSICHGHDWYPQYEFPTFANLPVNVSYCRHLLLTAIDRGLFGNPVVGAMIAARLLELEPDFRKQIFSPRPTIVWEAWSCDEESALTRLPADRPPEWIDLMAISRSLFGVAGIIPRHGCERERRGREAIMRFMGEHHFVRAILRLSEAIGYYPEVAYGHFYLRFWSFLDIGGILPDLRKGQAAACDAKALFERYKRKDLAWFSSGQADTLFEQLASGPDCVDPHFARRLTEQASIFAKLSKNLT
jgi:GT2 family glycosyltransferase